MANPNEDVVDVAAVIKEIMEDKTVDPKEVEEEKPFVLEDFLRDLKNRKWSERYFKRHVHGHFDCQYCGNMWTSNRAWCIVDLKEQVVKLRFKQECENYGKHKKHKSGDAVSSLSGQFSEKLGISGSEIDDLVPSDSDSLGADSLQDSDLYTRGLDFADDAVGSYPSFKDKNSVLCMVESAVNKHLEIVGRKEKETKYHDRQRSSNAPHNQSLCEMCKREGGPCW